MTLPITNERAGASVDGEAGTDGYMRIGEVAGALGLTQRTIRYYEELGLLAPPTRTQGDYRLYSEADVERLHEIKRLKKLLGFSLSEIKDIVEGHEAIGAWQAEYRATDDPDARRALLNRAIAVTEAQLGLVDAKLLQIHEMREGLDARLQRYLSRRQELPAPDGALGSK